MQGLLVDVVLMITRRQNFGSYMLAGGVSAASNVFAFQVLYFSGAPVAYIFLIAMIAFVSGVLFAGSFGHSVLEIVLQARPFRAFSAPGEAGTQGSRQAGGKKTGLSSLKFTVTVLLVLILSIGSVYYFAAVFEPPWIGPRCQVEGAVKNPLSFQLAQFDRYQTTISAELKGKISYIPPREYTGIPLKVILQEAEPLEGAQKLKVMATDGYLVEFELAKVLNDDHMLLIREEDMLRLIAGNYEGGYWVRMVNKLVVE